MPTTLLELCKLHNIVAIKEASGNISQVVQIKAFCRDKIDIIQEMMIKSFPIMSLGGIGVISVLANIIPKTVHNMAKNCLDKANLKKL